LERLVSLLLASNSGGKEKLRGQAILKLNLFSFYGLLMKVRG
jgi:hypothetical protein